MTHLISAAELAHEIEDVIDEDDEAVCLVLHAGRELAPHGRRHRFLALIQDLGVRDHRGERRLERRGRRGQEDVAKRAVGPLLLRERR